MYLVVKSLYNYVNLSRVWRKSSFFSSQISFY